MRAFNFFIDTVCIFVFLTLGSLMMIVSLKILPMEDALIKLQDLYESGFHRFQIGAAALLFIVTGLALTKLMVKKMRADDEFLVVGEGGQTTIRYSVVNELIERSLRKFDLIRNCEVSSNFEQQVLKISLNLVMAASAQLQGLTPLIENEIRERITKILGCEILIDVSINVIKIIDSPLQMAE